MLVPLGVLPEVAAAPSASRAAAAAPAPRPHQALIFRVVNSNARFRYLDWSLLRRRAPGCERRVGGKWQPCAMSPPFCVERCPENGVRVPCPECAKPPDVARIVPGKGHLDLPWDGLLYPLEKVPGHCSCYRPTAPPAGRYRLTFCAHASLWCHTLPGGCPKPGLDGEVPHGAPRGPASCARVEVSLPTRQRQIVVTLPVESR